jgi:competence protein ComEA
MLVYSRGQILVVLCILSLLFPLAFGKLYGPFREHTMACGTAPAAVYELRGAGIKEGYYSFKETQTARSLLLAAGGLLDGRGLAENAGMAADAPLRSGTRITFLPGGAAVRDCQAADMNAAARLNFFMPVALNAATLEDLMLIPGIGSKTAAAIIACRTAQRHIRTMEELKYIPGLGEKKLQAVAPFITIE